MAVDYSKSKLPSRYVYLPRIGEEATFDIKEIRETKEGNAKFQFVIKEEEELKSGGTTLVDKNLGYHIECDLKEGKILSINNIFAFNAVFIRHNIQDGELVKIKHIAKGDWETTILTRPIEEPATPADIPEEQVDMEALNEQQ